MKGKLLDKIRLDNDLVLELYDKSRKTAGDRYKVCFRAMIDVPIDPAFFDKSEQPTYREALETLGEKVSYIYGMERNFVAEKEKSGVLAEIAKTFLANSLVYLSAPDFARKLILRKFAIEKSHLSARAWGG